MAFITADRVRDTSSTAGSGAFSVSGTAPTGYRTFSAALSVSDTFYYCIQHQTLDEWEVGLGTYTSANTFSRTTVYSSSNAGSTVTFSAGTKDVFITMAAARSPQLNASGNVTALGTPVSATLTNATGLPLTTGVTGVLPFANGGNLSWQSVQTGNFTAVAGNAYPVNTTSGAVTVTLPASPSAGQSVILTDYAGTWGTNPIGINPNGNKLNSSTLTTYPATNRESLSLVYIDTTQGWIIYSGFNDSIPTSTFSVSYLVLAGGAGGGVGGGGAGGLLTGTTTLTTGTSYSIVVGGGGAGASAVSTRGTNGSVSSFNAIAPIGGGGGGSVSTTTTTINGASGGSGGGGGYQSVSPFTAGTGGSGTSGQGFAGGAANSGLTGFGGGGGASAVGGGTPAASTGANGGAGASSSITGSAVTYAGGGGGMGQNTGGTGGSGGGGNGARANATQIQPTAGTANFGGGGGGGSPASSPAISGAQGGSGVVIISLPTSFYTGTTTGSPTVTTSGSNTILTFTASGSYTA